MAREIHPPRTCQASNGANIPWGKCEEDKNVVSGRSEERQTRDTGWQEQWTLRRYCPTGPGVPNGR
eukprot:12133733-Karenia_brevis.AAC.1